MMKNNETFNPLSKQSGYHSIRGHNLYWEMNGSSQARGGDVVLLHHGLGSTQSWKRQIEPLLQNDLRVILHDRWGYGRSDQREEFVPGFLYKDAEETVELLRALEVQRATFVGHSDGGSIALIIANRYPELVERLILVAAHIYVESKMVNGLRLIDRASRASPMKDVLAKEHGARHTSLVEAWIKNWEQHGESALDLTNELDGIQCPTLVIQGMKDEHATPKHAIDIARGIPNAKLWSIPQVGHMPLHEITEEFNHHLIQFINHTETWQVPEIETGLARENV